MGTARIETPMDFARLAVDVAIRCGACRRTRTMTAQQLATIFGAAARLATVERRLRCSECGHKGAKLAPIPRTEGQR